MQPLPPPLGRKGKERKQTLPMQGYSSSSVDFREERHPNSSASSLPHSFLSSELFLGSAEQRETLHQQHDTGDEINESSPIPAAHQAPFEDLPSPARATSQTTQDLNILNWVLQAGTDQLIAVLSDYVKLRAEAGHYSHKCKELEEECHQLKLTIAVAEDERDFHKEQCTKAYQECERLKGELKCDPWASMNYNMYKRPTAHFIGSASGHPRASGFAHTRAHGGSNGQFVRHINAEPLRVNDNTSHQNFSQPFHNEKLRQQERAVTSVTDTNGRNPLQPSNEDKSSWQVSRVRPSRTPYESCISGSGARALQSSSFQPSPGRAAPSSVNRNSQSAFTQQSPNVVPSVRLSFHFNPNAADWRTNARPNN